QMGSTWQMEPWGLGCMTVVHGITRDLVGLKRSIERLSRAVGTGIGLEFELELARGDYHRERGDLDEALAAFERGMLLPAFRGPTRELFLAAYAETLVSAGRFEQARKV